MITAPFTLPADSRWTVLARVEDYISPGGQRRKRYLVECRCGTRKAVVESSLRRDSKSCGCLAREVSRARTKSTSNCAMHYRLRTRLGRAHTYACIDCGHQASVWSFKHPVGHSLDPSDYSPRCNSCHRLYDNRLLQEAYVREMEREGWEFRA